MRKRYDSERAADARYDEKLKNDGWQRKTIRFPPETIKFIESKMITGESFSETIIRLMMDESSR